MALEDNYIYRVLDRISKIQNSSILWEYSDTDPLEIGNEVGIRWVRNYLNDTYWFIDADGNAIQVDINDWGIHGNIGMNPETNYIGNYDDVDLPFRTNNEERVRITADGNVLIGTDVNSTSAILNLYSISKGFLPPRMTTSQKLEISNPEDGLMVFDTDLQGLSLYYNMTWNAIGGGGGVLSFNSRTGDVTLLDEDVISALGYTPENVANKVTTIVPELINDTEYPSTSAVFNWVNTELSTKFDIPTGTASDYLDGTGTPTPFPTMLSADKMITIGRNSTGDTLHKGTIIYLSGSTGNRPNFVKAQANAEGTSARTFGVILNDIPNNSDGNCVTIGTIDNLDTRSSAPNPFTTDTLLDGDTIYLSPTNAGYVTRVKPSAPNHLVYIGKVVRTSPTNGTIVYQIQNGFELDEIHDVQISSLQNNDLIQYDSATDLWKNKSLSNAGIESLSNKSTTIAGNETSNTLFPTIKSVVDWVTSLFIKGSTNTTNYVQKTNGTGTIGNSSIFDNGTFVGIGTTSDTGNGRLQISGNLAVRNAQPRINLVSSPGSGGIVFWNDGSNRFALGYGPLQGSETAGSLNLYSYGSSSTILSILANGKILMGANNSSVTSARLEVVSTSQGFLPPKMTTSQKNAISSPVSGLMVYDTTLNKLCVYNGTTWETITSA